MKKILVVDDEPSVREMITEFLEGPEREIKTAENGIQAREVLTSGDISLVVTDVVMAEENGIDLIMKMKTEYPSVPIVAISGGGGIEGRFDYLQIARLVGANQILKKPFTADKLRNIVDHTLSQMQ